jgi:CRP-like cAMP-binding protein
VEVAKTSDALRTTEFFADLGERQLAMMASAGVRRKLSRYNVLYREGAAATCFYVLVGGTLLEHSLDPQWREEPLRPGKRRPKGYRRDTRHLRCAKGAGREYTLFGMESLVGRPRTSTISVLGDCEVLKFAAENLNIRKDGAAMVARKVFDAFLEGELSHTYALRGMPSKRLKQLIEMLEQETHEAGETLYAPGNPGDKVYLLMHGSVCMLKGSVPLATLTAEQGQATSTEHGMAIFGENAMLDRRPRSLTCKVLAESTLLVLPLEQWAAATLAVPDLKARLRRGKEIRTADLG